MQQQLCMMDLMTLVFKVIDLICKTLENKFNTILILFFLTLSILGNISNLKILYFKKLTFLNINFPTCLSNFSIRNELVQSPKYCVSDCHDF